MSHRAEEQQLLTSEPIEKETETLVKKEFK